MHPTHTPSSSETVDGILTGLSSHMALERSKAAIQLQKLLSVPGASILTCSNYAPPWNRAGECACPGQVRLLIAVSLPLLRTPPHPKERTQAVTSLTLSSGFEAMLYRTPLLSTGKAGLQRSRSLRLAPQHHQSEQEQLKRADLAAHVAPQLPRCFPWRFILLQPAAGARRSWSSTSWQRRISARLRSISAGQLSRTPSPE